MAFNDISQYTSSNNLNTNQIKSLYYNVNQNKNNAISGEHTKIIKSNEFIGMNEQISSVSKVS